MNTNTTINQIWANLIIEECVRLGVDYFCLSPGSRSTPLALAVAQNQSAQAHIHFDERASAFHALGYSSATQKPSVIITTSGSAVANIFPAIIEASKKKIPLLILTADRPPELRFTGANQTIDQVKFFGQYVRWFFDMPCPTTDIPASTVLTTIDQAVFQSLGELKGPVHFNCMFREPLVPTKENKQNYNFYLKSLKQWLDSDKPFTTYKRASSTFSIDELKPLAKKLNRSTSGLILVGKTHDTTTQKQILALAEKLNWPIFPDISSGLRLGITHPLVINYFDQLLHSRSFQKTFTPHTIIQLGGRMTSKRVGQFVKTLTPEQYIMVLNHPLRNDPDHQVTDRFQTPVGLFCSRLNKILKSKPVRLPLKKLQEANLVIDRSIDAYLEKQNHLTDIEIARIISRLVPRQHTLFLGNSLPVRLFDSFADPFAAPNATNANRGASGIDGLIASACGYANGSNHPLTLVLGDLSALYDLNALSMLKSASQQIIIIIINNNGGGIFTHLPIYSNKHFRKFFASPHELKFKGAAEMFGLDYTSVTQTDDFYLSYKTALKNKQSGIIEVQTDMNHNVESMKGWEVFLRKYI
jgi:2-succinyl-5-enolpyruvyl-6-hydroxy-3-cyclohexene-1-carboxylate synthase